MLKNIQDLINLAKDSKEEILSVANPIDDHSLQAINDAGKLGFIKAILIGNKSIIEEKIKNLNLQTKHILEIIDIKDSKQAAYEAVKLVSSQKADILMKGLVDTAIYMKAILNKEYGLVKKGQTLSHITVLQFPTYKKLLIVSDIAVIPYPDLKQKIAITNYCIETAHLLGIEKPKVALIGAAEKVSDKLPSTLDAAIISKMADRGQIKGAIIDGPMALDLAISNEAVKIKKFNSQVGGDADILIFPNIEAGNVFFKEAIHLANAKIAAIVAGSIAPAVLTSRGDPEESKLYSIALATVISQKRKLKI